jgi:peptide/nickel transport system ATP-binding protein
VNILEIDNLHTDIALKTEVVRAVDGVSLTIAAGETLGLVGESGSGKTMTGMSVMKLLPPGGRIRGGSIRLNGLDVVPLDEPAMRAVRGNDVAVIFQDPLTSLNPTMTIGRQIEESLRIHRREQHRAARKRAIDVLGLVGMPRPAQRVDDYPHQLSGGLRQRVMIAMALVNEPKLLSADEPTTALDVTIQAQILDLLDELKRRLHMAVLLITHDLGVVAGRADRVAVMYAGRIVEEADTTALFRHVRHRYTDALLEAIPRLDQDAAAALYSIPGMPPTSHIRAKPAASHRAAVTPRRCAPRWSRSSSRTSRGTATGAITRRRERRLPHPPGAGPDPSAGQRCGHHLPHRARHSRRPGAAARR